MDFQKLVNETRLKEEFKELVEIDSPSFSERKMADRLKEKLHALGFSVTEDEAGNAYGGDAGNVCGYLKGSLEGEPILLSAHMDVVQPGYSKQAVFREDGRIVSGGDTVLGADDMAGVTEILEGIRILKESGIPHRDVEVLFPIGEELYIEGTSAFDFRRVKAKEAYVLDLSGEVGTAALKAPTILSFEIKIEGKASHAGFEPEKGIHAIALAGLALSQISMGHLDGETTLNIGTIRGGAGKNIVPEQCILEGEIRSYQHEKALKSMENLEKNFSETLKDTGAKLTVRTTVHMEAYQVAEDSPTVQRFRKACETLQLPGELTSTFGGSDNNNFVKNGIEGIVLSCGMYQVHSVQEYCTVEDLKKGAALVAALLSMK